jgi:ribosomal protein S20
MEKIGTPQDLAQIRKRYKEIVNETAVKTMLKKVLEEVPQEKLQRISDGHKERAYEVLYGKQ